MKTFIFRHEDFYGLAVINAPSKDQALQIVLKDFFLSSFALDDEECEINLDNLEEVDMSKEGVVALYVD